MVLPLGDLHHTRITPFVTYTLITINVLVYLVAGAAGRAVHHGVRLHALGNHAQRGHSTQPVLKPPTVVRMIDPRDPTGRHG